MGGFIRTSIWRPLPSYLPPNATAAAVQGELSIHLLWKERILRYWNRLCSDSTPVLLRQAVLHPNQLRSKQYLMGQVSLLPLLAQRVVSSKAPTHTRMYVVFHMTSWGILRKLLI